MADGSSSARSSTSAWTAPVRTRSAEPFSTPDPPAPALPPLIVIAGATATGKTALSLGLAEAIPGAEIVSADSRQVYRGMDIGTAKVPAADRVRVPHHGLDLVDPDQPFSAADYRRAAVDALTGIAARGGVAILVGGTGLYLRAVARGIALEETGHDPHAREDLERQLVGEGLHVLVARLRSAAPTVAANTDLANPRRVVRALERAQVHGDRLPPAPLGYPARQVWIGLQVEPPIHAGWIADRARAQFATGLLDEAERLRAHHGPDQRAFSAFGYQEAFGVLDGTVATEEAIDRTITRTKQFARRQRTWFRSESEVDWLDGAGDPLRAALDLVRKAGI